MFCGIEGVFIAKERDWTAQKGSKFHFNLYAITPDGKEVQMTKDHIIPKSLGGPNHPDNYQTACATCNKKKGNDIRFNLLTNNVSRERIQF